MRKFLTVLLFCSVFFTSSSAQAQTIVQKSNADIAQNLVLTNNSFASDLKQYGMMEMLESKGPFTIFAPTEELYKLAPEFTGVQKISYLKNHIVAQNISAKELAKQFKLNNNQIELIAISGNAISLSKVGDKIYVNMGSGATTIISTAPEESSNGTIMQMGNTN